MASEEQQAAAILALLNDHGANAYDLDDLKKLPTLPSSYTEFATGWRAGASERLCGRAGLEGYRFRTRAVAKTVSNVREMQERAIDALEGRCLVLADATSTPIRRESHTAIAEDDQWFTSLFVWTYVLPKTRSTTP